MALPCSILVISVLIGMNSVFNRREHVATLRYYANHTENIYIYSEHADDHTVRIRANNARELLLESGNKLNVKVLEIYFGIGEHCNETWEEFTTRRDSIIRTDRQSRHEWLLRQSDAFYKTYVLKQI